MLNRRVVAFVSVCLATLGFVALPTQALAAPVITYLLQPFAISEVVNSDALPPVTASLTTSTGSGTSTVEVSHGVLDLYALAAGSLSVNSSVAFEGRLLFYVDPMASSFTYTSETG